MFMVRKLSCNIKSHFERFFPRGNLRLCWLCARSQYWMHTLPLTAVLKEYREEILQEIFLLQASLLTLFLSQPGDPWKIYIL